MLPLAMKHAFRRPARSLLAHFVIPPSPFRKVKYNASTLVIKGDRLMHDIHETCRWGTGQAWGKEVTETGMSRLALSEDDAKARDWFAETTTSLGCKVTVDEMGNMFAVRPGKKDGAPTCAGSHLDTQPTGGRYDGILGVTAGVEMLRVLHENSHETEYPVGVVNWTNEEGARFPISMVSSGVWAGEISLHKAHTLASVTRGEEATMRSELERIGYLGDIPCSHKSMALAAHFELHIEQGPLLERAKQKIGVVQGVQAYKWFTIEVQGRDCHTGTTDLVNRADALLAAAKMIVKSRGVAAQLGGLASTGIIEALPGSTNTVPGFVRFSLDIRASSDEVVENIERKLRADFTIIAAGEEFETDENVPQDITAVNWRTDSVSPAVKFHPDCIACVTQASQDVIASDRGQLTRFMTSGAGHDSVYTSKRCPTCMIFVPSRDGVSHNPREYSSPEDCALGAQVLMGAILKFDARRTC